MHLRVICISILALHLLMVSAFAAGNGEQPTSNSAESESPVAPPPVPQSFIKMGMLSAKYDKLNPWDWKSVPYPSIGDTLDPEFAGIRPYLAEHNIGITLLYPGSHFDYNVKNPPMYGAYGAPYNQSIAAGTKQQYTGQRPEYMSGPYAYLTYNIPSTHTQFVVGATDCLVTSEALYGCSNLRMTGAYVNQQFFKSKVQLSAGYLTEAWGSVGMYTGGNMAGTTLGVNSILPAEAGQNEPQHMTPAATLRWDVTKHVYGVVGVQRSMSPDYNESNQHDAIGLRFSVPDAKAFEELELGYKRESAPGIKKFWLRLDGFYNSSHYFDYRAGSAAYLAFLNNNRLQTNRTNNNFASSNGVDYQFTQPDRVLPFRGLYAGGTVQYAPPQQNLYTAYYEARAYYLGLFKSRPLDMWTLMVNNTEFSKIAINTFQHTADYHVSIPGTPIGQTTADDGQTNYSVTWLAHLRSGLWSDVGLMYTEHPTVAPKVPNALVVSVGFSTYF
jgi:porin